MSSPLSLQTTRSIRWAGHSHVFRKSSAGPSLREHSGTMRRLGLNYFGFGHPWEGSDLELIREWESNPEDLRLYHGEEVWRGADPAYWTQPERFEKWRREFSTDDFIFEVDCETPKIRFGHLWWLGWQPEFAPWHDYDAGWSAWEVSPERLLGTPPPAFTQRIQARAIRAQVAMGALPVYAHPTSWWWGNDQHVSNIAATLVPDILTGQAAGCLVVMGYEANHKHYQELWFNLLNKGYFLTGVAETDACLDSAHFDRALYQNVTPVPDFSTRGIQEALKAGHNVMTTGPGLVITCGQHGPGDFCPAPDGLVQMACTGLNKDHTYQLDLIRNGTVVRSWTIAGEASFKIGFLNEHPGWVVARLVNKSLPYDAALTNPIFFRNPPVRVTGHLLPEKEIAWWDRPGALERCYYLTRGDWHNDFPACQPGEIPWDAFRWDDWVNFLRE